MANYSIVVDSKFNPLSFERLIQPYQMYDQVYREGEAAINQLQTQAETLRQRAIKEPDAQWSKRYNDYADSLEQSAQQLLTQGLTPSSRANINAARAAYARDIIPVQQAITRQQELAKTMQSANPSLRMQYENMPSIDALIADPTLEQRGYSGANVEQSAMQLASAASSRRTTDSFNQFQNYWMRHRKTSGYSDDEIAAFFNDASYVPELQNIIGIVSQQFGNFKGLDNRQKTIMAEEIMSGILKGATYKEDTDYQQLPNAVLNPTNSRGATGTSGQVEQSNLLPINPVNVFSSVEMDKEAKEHLKFSKFFDQNGKLTDKGKKEYDSDNSRFRKYIDTLNNNMFVRNKSDIDRLYSNKTKELQDAGKFYDIKKSTEFDYAPTSEDRQDWKDKITLAYRGVEDIPLMEFNPETGKYSQKKKETISLADLSSDKYQVVTLRTSVHGNIAIISGPEGKYYTVELPRGINPQVENLRDLELQRAEELRNILVNGSGAFTDEYGDSQQLTLGSQDEYNIIKSYWDQAIQNIYFYMSQLVGTNKTSPETYNYMGF